MKMKHRTSNKQLSLSAGRVLVDYERFDVKGESGSLLSAKMISANGEVSFVDAGLKILFEGKEASYQAKIILPRNYAANGLSALVKLDSWASIRYVAVGYTLRDNTFRHIKIPNIGLDRWVDLGFSHEDLIFGIQHKWPKVERDSIKDVRVYIKGTPYQGGASLYVKSCEVWNEEERNFSLDIDSKERGFCELIGKRDKSADALFSNQKKGLKDTVYAYWGRCFPDASHQAEKFILEGSVPLQNNVAVHWPVFQNKPQELNNSVSHRFSWHALTPIVFLLIKWRDERKISALALARELSNDWINESFITPDEDQKYAWYDHGVAERCLTLLLLWIEGVENEFDKRYLLKLLYVIHKHAQLLENEAFYSSHQRTRYHNHAWFQDIVLIAVSTALPEIKAADYWYERALSRLSEQCDKLIVREKGFAVFSENSIGYHHGIERLVKFVGELVSLKYNNNSILDILSELNRFSDHFRYPDGRVPSQGDTFRRPNKKVPSSSGENKEYREGVLILNEAGYGIAKGYHDSLSYVFIFYATSKSSTHKHQDNLSFTLYYDGVEWLIDPSMYSHEYDSPIPEYLRSARAHNNYYLSGCKYSLEPGLAELEGGQDNKRYYISGKHNAYENYEVTRYVDGRLDELDLRVNDCAVRRSGRESYLSFLVFHCGEGVKASVVSGGVLLSHEGSRKMLKIEVDSGELSLNKGWNEQTEFSGIAGKGFMETSETILITYKLGEAKNVQWRLFSP